MRPLILACLMLSLQTVVGCGGGQTTTTATTSTTSTVVGAPPAPGTSAPMGAAVDFRPDVDAGVPIAPAQNPAQLQNLVASLDARPRSDPFALTQAEKGFDARQLTERLNSESGSFPLMYEVPPPPSDTPEPEEQQPYRRLSGILVGDSVLAIIEMGNGTPPEIVRPGQVIPGTEWRVISIDNDKAVLRRPGKIKPNQITVRLEQRPPGFAGAGNGAPGGGGPANGGFGSGPGTPPGGQGGGAGSVAAGD